MCAGPVSLEITNFAAFINEINFFIYKFDNQNVYYRIIFNGTPKIFISRMKDLGHKINIQNEIWKLK